jgi:hypothetical protein
MQRILAWPLNKDDMLPPKRGLLLAFFFILVAGQNWRFGHFAELRNYLGALSSNSAVSFSFFFFIFGFILFYFFYIPSSYYQTLCITDGVFPKNLSMNVQNEHAQHSYFVRTIQVTMGRSCRYSTAALKPTRRILIELQQKQLQA